MSTGYENMTTLQLASLLEMYALLSASPDNLLETQESALHLSTELKYRVKGLVRLHGEMRRRLDGVPQEEVKDTNDLEKEGKELELRDQEEGWFTPNTSRP